MSAGPRLILKQSTGWFAAGWTFAEAMTVLSDAAFKLFAWLCLNADRHTGRIRITAAEIAQILGKSEREIQTARDELAERGVCCGMDLEVEIADPIVSAMRSERSWTWSSWAADHYAGTCGSRCARCRKSCAVPTAGGYWLTAMVTSGRLVTPFMVICTGTALPVGVPAAMTMLIW
jgi:hypothetical protein